MKFLDRLRKVFDVAPRAPSEAKSQEGMECEKKLGMSFSDGSLLTRALTHRSYANENPKDGIGNNERLEFLGDAVLDLVISEKLMEEFPQAAEGELSKLRSALVNERTLSQIAEELELGSFLRLGKGESLSGGRQKPSLLANAYEAILGALFLDQGLDVVSEKIDAHFASWIRIAHRGELTTDFKTQVQEIAQNKFQAPPQYKLISESGPDHEKTFEVELWVRQDRIGVGRGRSKKEAEQEAAKAALAAIKSS